MSFIYEYYGVSLVRRIFFLSSEPRPSGLIKRIYNSLCDVDEESISDMINEELDIDSDEFNLEI
jgi:hypothetical protein